MNSKFKLGDVVQLKSGGPFMTVRDTGKENLDCRWFDWSDHRYVVTAFSPIELQTVADDRIKKAIDLAVRYGGIDGDHHKSWVIDQMVRALAAERYSDVVRAAKDGPNGPETCDSQAEAAELLGVALAEAEGVTDPAAEELPPAEFRLRGEPPAWMSDPSLLPKRPPS